MTSATEPNIAASTARVRLIVWCKECQRHVEPDPVKIAERHDKLVCSRCGGRQVDVVSGTPSR